MNTKEKEKMVETKVPRITGLLLIRAEKSNPNGDPERESSPRQRPDGKGEISPVSLKRKLRDLIEKKEEMLWESINKNVALPGGYSFDIMESRERGWTDLKEPDETKKADDAWDKTSELIGSDFEGFKKKYWDARLFGNTFLEKAKEEKGIHDTIRAGVVHFGVGVSVAPIDIEFSTWTKKAPAEKGTTRGMAPMAYRVVKHGLYIMPFFVNPTQACKTGCTLADVQVMLHLLKYAYPHNSSVIRPGGMVDIIHAHTVEHIDPLGSFSDFSLLDALTPKRIPEQEKIKPAEDMAEYKIPTWSDIKDEPVRQGKSVKWSEVGKYTDYAL